MNYKRSFLENTNFLLKFLFSSHFNTHRLDYDNQEKWILEQLKDNKKMFIYDNTLSIFNDDSIFNEFKKSVDTGKEISLICGPKILVDVQTGFNDFFNYLKSNKNNNLKTYGIPDKNLKYIFHSIHNGRNVLIERPHFPSEKESGYFILENSVLWDNKLDLIFRKILSKGTVPINQLETLTSEGMKFYENTEKFSKQKERIIKSKEYNLSHK